MIRCPNEEKKVKTKKLMLLSLFTSIALTIFLIELRIPTLVPIPGVKLGLANIITVYGMFTLGPKDTLKILLVRIFLGSLFSGAVMTLLYSLSGGMLCYFVMLFLRKWIKKDQVWVCGVLGAVAHNVGQIMMAMFVSGTWKIVAYLPVLMFSGVIAGLFTGFCAQFLIKKLENSLALKYFIEDK